MTDTSPDHASGRYGHSGEAERMMQYDANKKSVLIAYLLWFFLGTFAVHRFYLGAHKSALVMLAMWVIFGALSGITFGIFGFLLLIPAIWWFLDLFLIPGIARDKNNELILMLSR
ncbi:TM2 domain-containing protein [Thalassobaculum sp. OXR-137]|uniref:TM2 domain-containing protein n=1 Tax=Thalassobaculum sp. OXR-137 TaxID=3100173 RepID=UPI002AC9496D|nr:TM2 domain-containing protein [Thalassobaculum sp. OXR-137]WPZ35704.1 TM2 domain-containing protein [Thalassobaculum sp. OXR-137]